MELEQKKQLIEKFLKEGTDGVRKIAHGSLGPLAVNPTQLKADLQLLVPLDRLPDVVWSLANEVTSIQDKDKAEAQLVQLQTLFPEEYKEGQRRAAALMRTFRD